MRCAYPCSRPVVDKPALITSNDPVRVPVLESTRLFAQPIPKRIEDLDKIDHRLYFLAQCSRMSWSRVRSTLIKERLVEEKKFDAAGGIAVLKTRLDQIRAALQDYSVSDDKTEESDHPETPNGDPPDRVAPPITHAAEVEPGS